MTHRVLLGYIGEAHGIRGEVVVQSYTADAADIAAYGPLYDEHSRRLVLSIVRVAKKGVVARIAGVGDRTSAEALRGTKLYVDRACLPPTAQDEFYHSDLIGLDVFDGAGIRLGHVVAMHNFGAGDLLEIELAPGRSELLPFDATCVTSVDAQDRRLVISPPAGWLDG